MKSMKILTTWMIHLDELDHMNEIGPYGWTRRFAMNFDMDRIKPYLSLVVSTFFGEPP